MLLVLRNTHERKIRLMSELIPIQSSLHILLDGVEYLTIRRFKDCVRFYNIDITQSSKNDRLKKNEVLINGEDTQEIKQLFPTESNPITGQRDRDGNIKHGGQKLHKKVILQQFYQVSFPDYIPFEKPIPKIVVSKYLYGACDALVNVDERWMTINIFRQLCKNGSRPIADFDRDKFDCGMDVDLEEFKIGLKHKNLPHLYITEPFGARLFPALLLEEYFGIQSYRLHPEWRSQPDKNY